MLRTSCFTLMYSYLLENKFCLPSVPQIDISASEYNLNDKNICTWYFKNGTRVHANSYENATKKIKETVEITRNSSNYWASMHDLNTWEVQFSYSSLPSVYIIVEADSGKEAAIVAMKNIISDLKDLELIKVI